MIGASEILIVAAIALLVLFSQRRGRPVQKSPDVWEVSASVRIPRYLFTVIGAVLAGLATAAAVLWFDLPGFIGTLATGLVAGLVAALLANRRR